MTWTAKGSPPPPVMARTQAEDRHSSLDVAGTSQNLGLLPSAALGGQETSLALKATFC